MKGGRCGWRDTVEIWLWGLWGGIVGGVVESWSRRRLWI